ncbi:hypothetical protein ABZX40_39345 [Streptomyces sp. NPDC004610]|uniref:hypothetical protein n=1 Tax=unclassified Streptomyces TaxID=2593676 RepID=UPI0033B65790
MTTLPQLRKAALALPEVEEGTRSRTVVASFSVRGKGFVAVGAGGEVRLQLPVEEVRRASVTHPSGAQLLRGGTTIGFRVPLADINGKDLNALVRAAWFHRAPKRLAATLTAAESAADAPAHALPRAIGRPATQALLGAGIDTLERVAEHSGTELLALHGVGPKAVRILRETLAEGGLNLR